MVQNVYSSMYVCSDWPVGQSGNIQNVCLYMHVYSDWSSETSRGSSERVYVHVRVLRLVQWDIHNVCMFIYVFSDWYSGTFTTCVCSCTCSQTGTVGHSQHVYVHVRVLRLVQWDIQNEHIAGHYYEERLKNENITKSFYVRARKLDSETKLYLNEYQCITSGAQTEVGTRVF